MQSLPVPKFAKLLLHKLGVYFSTVPKAAWEVLCLPGVCDYTAAST